MPSSDSAENRPRAVGSATSWPRNGCASIVRSIRSDSCLRIEEQQPLLLQEGRCVGPADGDEMRVIGRQLRCAGRPRWRRPPPGCCASITATSRSLNCGKSRLNWMARCRQGRLCANIWSVSVLTPRPCIATQVQNPASTMPARTMATAFRRQTSARPTSKRVSIRSRSSVWEGRNLIVASTGLVHVSADARSGYRGRLCTSL